MLIYSQNKSECVVLERFFGVTADVTPTSEGKYLVGAIANYENEGSAIVHKLGEYDKKEHADDVLKTLLRRYEEGDKTFSMPEAY